MSRVSLDPDLDVIVAERIMRPRIDDALTMLRDAAVRLAPECKVWISKRDDRVRRSHDLNTGADGQIVPANLRFKVPKADGGQGHDLARYPLDPNLPIANRINCRCSAPALPDPLRRSIKRTQVMVIGTRVEGSVYTEFPRAAESEFGTSQDTPAHYMTGALQEVVGRLRSGQTR